jgi:hypothetical protein
MSSREAPTSRRTWVIVLSAALLTCGLAGGGLLWAASRVAGLFTEPTWRPDAIPQAELFRTFGVRLSTQPLRYVSRNSGFQDPYLEALILLPPEAASRFLAENGLTEGGSPAQDTGAAEDEVHALAPDTPELSAVGLDGFHHLQVGDGGFVALYRHGALLRAEGVTWVYLVAFGT